jgi:protein-S-isoprenylcysteine O-methyltransferase Ste14
MSNREKENQLEKKFHTPLLVAAIIFATAIQIPLLFWPAGTFIWVEGWVYLAIFFVSFCFIFILLNKRNPEILINRMKMKKQAFRKKEDEMSEDKKEVKKASATDKIIFPIFSILFLLVFIVPAFDKRFHWSITWIWSEIIGFVLLPFSFYIIYRVMLENAYASKVLDIRKDSGHKVIDTGPYAIVRHPLYSGFAFMMFSVVLALGSWYAIIPAILAIIFLVIRIKFEEEMLIKGLAGYKEYKEKVKFKMIPNMY